MKLRDLLIGTKLELEPLNADGTERENTLVSEFEGVEGENDIMIAAPIYEGVLFPIHAGTHMNVYFINKNAGDNTLYRFKAIVTGRGRSENVALLKIEAVSEIEKVQRRSYYRLECSLPVMFRQVESFNPAHSEGVPFKKTLASNLSGGGIRLLLEEKLEAGKIVECEIRVGEEKLIRFFGRVMRHEVREDEGRFKYEAGIAYIKISKNDREAVVKYIFDEQRKLRKKGLI